MTDRTQQLTCDEQPPLAVEVQQGLPSLTLPVLDHVSFIQDEVLPLLAPKHFSILRINGRSQADLVLPASACKNKSCSIRSMHHIL